MSFLNKPGRYVGGLEKLNNSPFPSGSTLGKSEIMGCLAPSNSRLPILLSAHLAERRLNSSLSTPRGELLAPKPGAGLRGQFGSLAARSQGMVCGCHFGGGLTANQKETHLFWGVLV